MGLQILTLTTVCNQLKAIVFLTIVNFGLFPIVRESLEKDEDPLFDEGTAAVGCRA